MTHNDTLGNQCWPVLGNNDLLITSCLPPRHTSLPETLFLDFHVGFVSYFWTDLFHGGDEIALEGAGLALSARLLGVESMGPAIITLERVHSVGASMENGPTRTRLIIWVALGECASL